jgi:hypothetical protein
MTTELLSAAEAARILGVPRSRVVDLADTDPAFPAFQPSSVGGRVWPRAAVEAWAAAHPDRGPLHRGPTLPEVGGRSPQVWTVANLAGRVEPVPAQPVRQRRAGDGTIPGMKRPPGALTLSEDDRRVLAVWAADCAERTLSLFEAQAPSDTRPRDAIDGLRAFARGDMRIGRVRALSAQAHAAAREVGDPAARAAARAAGHAAGVAHMAAHARGAPAYAAMAAGLAAPGDPTAVRDEVRWALHHASPTVRDVLRRLPPPPRPAGMLRALINDMHTRLTGGG